MCFLSTLVLFTFLASHWDGYSGPYVVMYYMLSAPIEMQTSWMMFGSLELPAWARRQWNGFGLHLLLLSRAVFSAETHWVPGTGNIVCFLMTSLTVGLFWLV